MENSESGSNPVDFIRGRFQKTLGEARMPTEGYESAMVIYGGKLVKDPQGRMVFDTRGLKSQVDKRGDEFLRTYDEHTVKDPSKLLRRHPGWFFKFIMPGAKRYRGSNQEIAGNIQRLGLEDYYGSHPWGIEIKKPEVFTKGIPFQDIYRADLIKAEKLNNIDRFQALAEAAKYMRHIHGQYGAIGEGVPYRFIFQTQQGNVVKDPVLFIPDIVYNPKKYTPEHPGETDQKATDLLEFLTSTAIEELRRSAQDLNLVKQALDVAIQNYGDQRIISVASSFAKRGRPTLTGWLVSQHNRAHLGFDPKTSNQLNQLVIEACQKFRAAK